MPTTKTVTPGKHGYGPYSNGCRCGICTEAKRRYMQTRRTKGIPTDSPLHGSYTGYDSYNCRCQACTAAKVQHREAHPRTRKGGV